MSDPEQSLGYSLASLGEGYASIGDFSEAFAVLDDAAVAVGGQEDAAVTWEILLRVSRELFAKGFRTEAMSLAEKALGSISVKDPARAAVIHEELQKWQ